MNTYIAIFNGKQREIMAKSMYEAKTAAIAYFNVKPSKVGLIGIYLAETADGTKVNIIPQTF